MKKSITFFTVVLVFTLISDLKAQTFPLSDFVETILPKPNSPERTQVFRSGYEFVVNIRNGKPRIKEYKQKRYDGYDNAVSLVVDNGWIIGTDEGEFVGELWFENQAHDTTIIKHGDIHFIFRYDREIYFIEGLGHGSINEGALYKLTFIEGAYKYQKVLDFGDAPEVMCIVNGDILVASFDNLYKIHDFKMEKIFPDLLAYDLLPRSLAATDDRHVYMGVAEGYVQIDLIEKSYMFYKFNKTP